MPVRPVNKLAAAVQIQAEQVGAFTHVSAFPCSSQLVVSRLPDVSKKAVGQAASHLVLGYRAVQDWDSPPFQVATFCAPASKRDSGAKHCLGWQEGVCPVRQASVAAFAVQIVVNNKPDFR